MSGRAERCAKIAVGLLSAKHDGRRVETPVGSLCSGRPPASVCAAEPVRAAPIEHVRETTSELIDRARQDEPVPLARAHEQQPKCALTGKVGWGSKHRALIERDRHQWWTLRAYRCRHCCAFHLGNIREA